MLADWYRVGVTLDYPKGGSGEIANALVRGVKKNGGELCLNSHVDEIIVENNRAVGVKLASGKVIRARQAVVSNADPFVTNKLLSKAREEGLLHEEAAKYMDSLINTDAENGGVPNLKSFIHIHAGIDATGLPTVASEGKRECMSSLIALHLLSFLTTGTDQIFRHNGLLYAIGMDQKELKILETLCFVRCLPLLTHRLLRRVSMCFMLTYPLLNHTSGGKEWTGIPLNTKRRKMKRLISCGALSRSTFQMQEIEQFLVRFK
jgi:hypothetical protein